MSDTRHDFSVDKVDLPSSNSSELNSPVASSINTSLQDPSQSGKTVSFSPTGPECEPGQLFPAVRLALRIDRLLNKVDEETRKDVLNILWFYHVGRHMDWTGSAYRREKQPGRKRTGRVR